MSDRRLVTVELVIEDWSDAPIGFEDFEAAEIVKAVRDHVPEWLNHFVSNVSLVNVSG